jgi:hypothetical protein
MTAPSLMVAMLTMPRSPLAIIKEYIEQQRRPA